MVATTSSGLALLLTKIQKYQRLAEEINAACAAKGCPPAFEINLDPETGKDVMFRASEDYRYEGFGVVVGLPMKMQFYVHYLPRKVEIGRFLVPINLWDLPL